jgi:hypothetical protein
MEPSGKSGWLAAVVAVFGALQAIDSGVLAESVLVQVLCVLAVVSPVVALGARTGPRVLAGSVVIMAVLLTSARLMASSALNELHVMLVPATLLVATVTVRRRVEEHP